MTKRCPSVLSKLFQPQHGLPSRDRPDSIGLSTPALRDATQHLLINLVLGKSRERGPCATIARRRLAIVVINVPSPTYWLFTIHENTEPRSLPSIKVPHFEALTRTSPLREIVVVTQELIIANDGDTQSLQHRFAVPTHRLNRDHLSDVVLSAMGSQPRPPGSMPADRRLRILLPRARRQSETWQKQHIAETRRWRRCICHLFDMNHYCEHTVISRTVLRSRLSFADHYVRTVPL